jgi:hypothetical protein
MRTNHFLLAPVVDHRDIIGAKSALGKEFLESRGEYNYVAGRSVYEPTPAVDDAKNIPVPHRSRREKAIRPDVLDVVDERNPTRVTKGGSR